MRKREIKQRMALWYMFYQAVRHFKLSPAAEAIAWETALLDREKAQRCYSAIVRSL